MSFDRTIFRNGLCLILTTGLFSVACKSSGENSGADFADASLDAFGCKQECELQIYSPCTCGPDDPCGWQNDGTCDRKCLFNDIVERMFEDALDCPGACEGACESGLYTDCSCAVDDLCGWGEDSDCDMACIEEAYVEVMFDDRADCPDFPVDGGM